MRWSSGYLYGGATVLEHYTLRWLLFRNGSLPQRLVPFLDYCVQRTFLRRVGGGRRGNAMTTGDEPNDTNTSSQQTSINTRGGDVAGRDITMRDNCPFVANP